MNNNKISPNQWVMSFDFGLSRIGVAIGNTHLKIPHPIETVVGRNKFEKLDKIAKLIEKWQPRVLVVGLPSAINESFLRSKNPYEELTLDNIDKLKQDILTQIKKFANRLNNKFKLPVEFINEDYSSSIAVHKLNEQAIRGMAQKANLDTIAACVILQFYFDSLRVGI